MSNIVFSHVMDITKKVELLEQKKFNHKIGIQEKNHLKAYHALLSYFKAVAKIQAQEQHTTPELLVEKTKEAIRQLEAEMKVKNIKSKAVLASFTEQLNYNYKLMENPNLLKGKIIYSNQEVILASKKLTSAILDLDDFVKQTLFQAPNNMSGFLVREKTGEQSVHGPNVLLALEILDHNFENYNKLLHIKQVEEKNQTLHRGDYFFTTLSNENLIKQLKVEAQKERRRKEQITRAYDHLSELQKGPFQKLKNYFTIKQVKANLASFPASAVGVNKQGLNSADQALYLLAKTEFFKSPEFLQFSQKKLLSPALFSQNLSYLYQASDQSNYLLEKLSQLQQLANDDNLKKAYEDYKNQNLIHGEQLAFLKEQINPTVQNADIRHMQRIMYYGKNRIGTEDTPIFDETKETLRLLLLLNQFQKLSTSTIVMLSQEEHMAITSEIDAQIKEEITRKR